MNEELNRLYKIIEDKFGLTEERIKSGARDRDLVDMRRIIAITLLRNTRMSLVSVGDAIGRDHSNICHYKSTTDSLIETDKDFRRDFNYVNSEFRKISGGKTLEQKLVHLRDMRDNIDKEIRETEEEIRNI